MDQQPVIERVTAIRRAIRRRLALYGLFAVGAGGAAAFLTIVTIDWLLWLPPAIRMVTAGFFFLGFILATLRWIVRPLQARLDLGEVASHLEARFRSLRDRLVSAVNFLEHGGVGSPAMIDRVVDNAARAIHNVPLERALSLRPVVSRAALLVLSMGVLLTMAAVRPGWVSTGVYRYVYPWGRIEWPRAVSIQPLTGDTVIAVGDSVAVSMSVQRGLSDGLRAIVRFRGRGDTPGALTMHRSAGGVFSATIDSVTSDLTYWFEAGDDSTKQTPSHVRVVRRPELVDAIAIVEPPPYATEQTTRTVDLSDGPVHAVRGGHAVISVRSGKPISGESKTASAGLRLESGAYVRLMPAADRRLSVRLPVDEAVSFHVELRDEFGIENRGAEQYRIIAEPDRPPTVMILEPAAVTDVTPRGSVPLRIRAQDDLGVAELAWEVARATGEQPDTIPLSDRLEVRTGDRGVTARVEYDWTLAPLELHPGDNLIGTAIARDGRAAAWGGAQETRSAPVRIKIISETEFEIRLRHDTATLETRLRRILIEQAELLGESRDLEDRLASTDRDAGLAPARRSAVGGLAAQQSRLARRVEDVSTRLIGLRDRMARNAWGDAPQRDRFVSLAGALRQVASGPMRDASRAMRDVQQSTDKPRQQDGLGETVAAQEATLNRIRAVLRALSQWGGFRAIVTKTQDLIDRQEKVQAETAEVGKSLLGRRLSELSKEEAAELARVERRQKQIARDVGDMIDRMRRLRDDDRSADDADREALDAALRAADAHDASKHPRAAADAIKQNRTAAAALEQRLAAEALRKMVDGLQLRDSRRLDELRKRLDEARDQIASLIEQQRLLQAATVEAVPADHDTTHLGALAAEQRTLKRNTRLLGEELALSPQGTVAAEHVRRAARPMGEAEFLLHEKDASRAVAAQGEALALLERAIEALERAARAAEMTALRRSLRQISDILQRIRSAQVEVNTGIGRLRKAIAAKGRAGRAETRAASRLARQQHAVRSLVADQVRELKNVIVYHWALERVAGWMEQSRDQLRARRIDDQLVATADRIVGELDRLIGAIAETESLPLDTQFVESGREGGGEGGKSGAKPVPTVAELLMLRSMQRDLNGRTQALNAALDADVPQEERLAELRTLGEDQEEIRQLTRRVTTRAQDSP